MRLYCDFLLRLLAEYACVSCHASTPLRLSDRNKTNLVALAQTYIRFLSIIACNMVFSLPHEVGCPPPLDLSMSWLGFLWLGTTYKVNFIEAGSLVVEEAA
jgi:hypothetical protein